MKGFCHLVRGCGRGGGFEARDRQRWQDRVARGGVTGGCVLGPLVLVAPGVRQGAQRVLRALLRALRRGSRNDGGHAVAAAQGKI